MLGDPPALPGGGVGQSTAVAFCPAHWGFPAGLLVAITPGFGRELSKDPDQAPARALEGREEPRRTARRPVGRLPDLSRLREGAEKVSQGAQLQQETLCPQQAED